MSLRFNPRVRDVAATSTRLACAVLAVSLAFCTVSRFVQLSTQIHHGTAVRKSESKAQRQAFDSSSLSGCAEPSVGQMWFDSPTKVGHVVYRQPRLISRFEEASTWNRPPPAI